MDNFVMMIMQLFTGFWMISWAITAALLVLTVITIFKVSAFKKDRRRHFDPLQAIVAGTGFFMALVYFMLSITDLLPKRLLIFDIPVPLPAIGAFICVLAILVERVYQSRLPLTNAQKRHRQKRYS